MLLNRFFKKGKKTSNSGHQQQQHHSQNSIALLLNPHPLNQQPHQILHNNLHWDQPPQHQYVNAPEVIQYPKTYQGDGNLDTSISVREGEFGRVHKRPHGAKLTSEVAQPAFDIRSAEVENKGNLAHVSAPSPFIDLSQPQKIVPQKVVIQVAEETRIPYEKRGFSVSSHFQCTLLYACFVPPKLEKIKNVLQQLNLHLQVHDIHDTVNGAVKTLSNGYHSVVDGVTSGITSVRDSITTVGDSVSTVASYFNPLEYFPSRDELKPEEIVKSEVVPAVHSLPVRQVS